MSKWYGVIGFVDSLETSPGVWENIAVEVQMYGDMTRNHKRWEQGHSINDDITLQNELSVVYDSNAVQYSITRIIPAKLIIEDGYIVFQNGKPLEVPMPVENVLTIQNIKYVEFMDSLWKVTSVDMQYPRLVLSIGGVYNGPQAESAD